MRFSAAKDAVATKFPRRLSWKVGAAAACVLIGCISIAVVFVTSRELSERSLPPAPVLAGSHRRGARPAKRFVCSGEPTLGGCDFAGIQFREGHSLQRIRPNGRDAEDCRSIGNRPDLITRPHVALTICAG